MVNQNPGTNGVCFLKAIPNEDESTVGSSWSGEGPPFWRSDHLYSSQATGEGPPPIHSSLDTFTCHSETNSNLYKYVLCISLQSSSTFS